jgi:hypothetical protein
MGTTKGGFSAGGPRHLCFNHAFRSAWFLYVSAVLLTASTNEDQTGMNKPKIKLIANVPCALTLENPHGKETTSQFHDGVEYMYNVICQGEPSVLFLPADGSLAITRLAPRPGDEIELLKTLRSNRPFFQARHVGQEEPQQRQAPAVPYQREAPPAPGVRMLAPRSQVAPRPAPTPTPAPFAPMPGELAQRPAPAATVHPLEDLMVGCLVTAGRSVWRAYEELKKSGCDFDKPMIEDVRALGITMYIERTRNQGAAR